MKTTILLIAFCVVIVAIIAYIAYVVIASKNHTADTTLTADDMFKVAPEQSKLSKFFYGKNED